MGWCLRFEAYTALLGYERFLVAAVENADVIRNEQLSAEAVECSRVMWHLLVSYLDGRALGILKLVGRHCGLEAWRSLKLEYEGRAGNRFTAMLRFILNLSERWMSDKDKGIDFFQSLTAWEALCADYMLQSGELLSDNT